MRGCDREAGHGRVVTEPMRVSGVRSPGKSGPLFRPGTRPVHGDVTVEACAARDFEKMSLIPQALNFLSIGIVLPVAAAGAPGRPALQS